MARSNDALMLLLHLLQQLASRIGLVLNGSKCQLLSIHSNQPISLSLSAASDLPCDCPRCAAFYGVEPQPLFSELLTPVLHAKYLGSFVPSTSSNPDVSFRCSQASRAFKCLDPFFRRALISPRRKFHVYSQIV